jgi:hypothetical protein
VRVPAGTATWSTIDGHEAHNARRRRAWGTDIRVNVSSNSPLISHAPTDALSAVPFRLSDFTLDANGTANVLLRIIRTTVTRPTYIRIDHDHFIAAQLAIPMHELTE